MFQAYGPAHYSHDHFWMAAGNRPTMVDSFEFISKFVRRVLLAKKPTPDKLRFWKIVSRVKTKLQNQSGARTMTQPADESSFFVHWKALAFLEGDLGRTTWAHSLLHSQRGDHYEETNQRRISSECSIGIFFRSWTIDGFDNFWI